ncbi:MAG: hypothetical protein KatS3mg060_0713 [Dehalococcoidia bacterium]|nr:MAG: hypothetical protein KatS3mg060_0713 [Dehalococcoidia bacterium]
MNRQERLRVHHERVSGRVSQLASELTELFVLLGDRSPRLREAVEADLRQIVGRYITDEYLHLGLIAPRTEDE